MSRQPSAELVQLFQPVEEGLDAMRACLEEQLVESSHAVADMTGHVSRFRGKQLRAALVLLSAKACGTYTAEHPQVAAVVEMIHLATLVHDDILDGAEVRRRVACVNQRWDNQVAVLLGDFLYARAFALSTTLSSRLCSRLLAETTRTLCVGEIEQRPRACTRPPASWARATRAVRSSWATRWLRSDASSASRSSSSTTASTWWATRRSSASRPAPTWPTAR